MIKGGCLCGATRYEIGAEPRFTSYCHCEDCRKASGAPVVAWTFFPAGTLRWSHGEPKLLKFAGRERTFCPECGSPLSFFDPSFPSEYEVTTCSLDDPGLMPPHDHTWVEDRLSWFEVADTLPRHARYTG
ncbi:GFA family protein [Luteolibacter luteus]|uniref:GFA family protein n=1 Tax=Luteolibacter luteus TaxID=2728835 RepID=A0A858RDX6_9BACT|nr:GFA family protein [Luteolibacter luteus]QJE94932.1 GFA family protein [Luteolibacter luteus]